MNPLGIFAVAPSCLSIGEEFQLSVKVLGPARAIPCQSFAWTPRQPKLAGPFNRCVGKKIQYLDNVLPEWRGKLIVDGGGVLDGPRQLGFDGKCQGAFSGDTRPIRRSGGFHWKKAGFHFIRLTEPVSGVTACSNPILVSEGTQIRNQAPS